MYMKNNKGLAPLVVLLVVLGVLVVGGVAYFAGKSSVSKNQVSDNSSHSFVQQNQISPLVSSSQLPKQVLQQPSLTLPQYIGSHSDCGGPSPCWPPIISTSANAYSCVPQNSNTLTPGTGVQKNINGRTYCVWSFGDGYAGGVGWTYAYVTANGAGTKTAVFGITYQNCGVYGGPTDPVVIQCTSNQTTFKNNLDTLIDSLM